jgi:hypothetical protein
MVETIIWQGIGNLVNSFRRKTLGLEPVDSTWAPGMISRLEVPHTYLWLVLSFVFRDPAADSVAGHQV